MSIVNSEVANGKYIKYQHIERPMADEVDGLLEGKCYVFPKLDGTNMQIWRDSGGFHFGSRSRELSLDDDHSGFMAKFSKDETLLKFADLFIGKRVFGEFLILHTIKDYVDSAWNRFYVFDVFDPKTGRYLPYTAWQPVAKDLGVDYIPCMEIVHNPSHEYLAGLVKENKLLLPENYEGCGEGVIVKNYDFVNRFGRQTWAKFITSGFKVKPSKAPVAHSKTFEERIVDEFLTVDICQKVFANIKAESGWASKFIPRLLNTVYYDLVRECSWDIIKRYRNPKIDFKLIQKYCTERTRELMPDLF